MKRIFSPFTFIILPWIGLLLATFGVYWYVNAVTTNENGWFGEMPDRKHLENPSSEYSSELYSADSLLLGKYFRSNRTQVTYEDLSPNVINALIATEDIRYREHSGIDFKGTFAILYYLAKGEKRGSSTISQQLAKNLFNTRAENLRGSLHGKNFFINKLIDKTKEWVLAVQLEKSYTKEEIITMYLNTVDFGSNSFGIQVAAKTFFGKNQDELNIEEAAMLVGLLKAPTSYSPILNPDNAFKRRNTVLDQLEKYQVITSHEADSLRKDSIHLNYVVESHRTGSAKYFRMEAKKFLIYWAKENGYDLYSDGLKVYTTIDSRLQNYAEQAVREHMTELQERFDKHWKGRDPWSKRDLEATYTKYVLDSSYFPRALNRLPYYRSLKKRFKKNSDSVDFYLNKKKPMRVFTWQGPVDTTFSTIDSLKYYKRFLHAGFLSVDPTSGEIKAWVGGINYNTFQFDHVQHGKRQPGSTFKPIVYASVLGESNAYTPCSKFQDIPVSFITYVDGEAVPWTPKNADGTYSGEWMTLRKALANSVNAITAGLMKDFGENATPPLVVRYARELGIESHLEAVPSMCLGVFDVSLYEMVGAYSTFVNEGTYIRPYFIDKIVDRHGNVVADFGKEERFVMDKYKAFTMLYMLMGTTQESGGTALGLHKYKLLGYGNEVAAKTGTTQDQSDGWFMGLTPQLVSGVWVGGDSRNIHFRSIKEGQGARMAMPIWAEYMQRVYADTTLDIKKQRFKRPSTNFDMEIYDCSKQAEMADSTAPADLLIPSDESFDDDEL